MLNKDHISVKILMDHFKRENYKGDIEEKALAQANKFLENSIDNLDYFKEIFNLILPLFLGSPEGEAQLKSISIQALNHISFYTTASPCIVESLFNKALKIKNGRPYSFDNERYINQIIHLFKKCDYEPFMTLKRACISKVISTSKNEPTVFAKHFANQIANLPKELQEEVIEKWKEKNP